MPSIHQCVHLADPPLGCCGSWLMTQPRAELRRLRIPGANHKPFSRWPLVCVYANTALTTGWPLADHWWPHSVCRVWLWRGPGGLRRCVSHEKKTTQLAGGDAIPPEGSLNISLGRFVPTISWSSVCHGVHWLMLYMYQVTCYVWSDPLHLDIIITKNELKQLLWLRK